MTRTASSLRTSGTPFISVERIQLQSPNSVHTWTMGGYCLRIKNYTGMRWVSQNTIPEKNSPSLATATLPFVSAWIGIYTEWTFQFVTDECTQRCKICSSFANKWRQKGRSSHNVTFPRTIKTISFSHDFVRHSLIFQVSGNPVFTQIYSLACTATT